jgi:hypothetical protein
MMSTRARSGPGLRNPCAAPGGAAMSAPGPGQDDFVAGEKLDVAIENVHAVGVIVGVLCHFEGRVELEFVD